MRELNGRIAKGNSLNPGGRPKGLAARIRAETADGALLVETMLNIVRARTIKSTARDRIEAVRWLADRAYGRTPETVLTGSLSPEQVETMGELTREQLLSLASGPVVDGEVVRRDTDS
jgi:hypothetical protein